MPCGCVNEKFPMRFVGWKDGNLIKGAPSLPQGTIQENFLEYASLPYWVLVGPLPAIKKVSEPTLEESVYEEDKEPEEIEEITVKEPEVIEDIDLMTVTTLKLFIEQQGGMVDRTWLKADLVREARELEESLRTESVEPEPDDGEIIGDFDPDDHGDTPLEEPEEES